MLGLLYIIVFVIGHIGVACLMVIWTCELFREIVNVAHCEVNPAREVNAHANVPRLNLFRSCYLVDVPRLIELYVFG